MQTLLITIYYEVTMATINARPIYQQTLATELSAADVFSIIDVTDTTQSPSGSSKKCPVSLLGTFVNHNVGQANVALTGTITVTNGSPNIVGAGTAFGSQLAIGEGPASIKIAGVLYTVSNVSSNTAATLTTNYAGLTTSGLTAFTDESFLTETTSNNVLVAQIANDGSFITQGSVVAERNLTGGNVFVNTLLETPSIIDDGSSVSISHPTTISKTLTGAYHPTRSADMSVGEGTAMVTADANGVVVSTNTASGNFIPLFSTTGTVPLGFTTKVVMGNTGHISFVAEGADNIRNVSATTTLTTQYATGTLTLISNGNWLLEIITT